MSEWIARRESKGIYHQLVKEFKVEDLAAHLLTIHLSNHRLFSQKRRLKARRSPPSLSLTRPSKNRIEYNFICSVHS